MRLVAALLVVGIALNALAMLRVRGIERVRLHADLTILGRLALELARLRAMVPAT